MRRPLQAAHEQGDCIHPVLFDIIDNMLSEERVRTMTKAQIIADRDGKDTVPMTAYFRWDYIGRQILISILSGTAVFFLTVLLIFLDDIEAMINAIDFTDAGNSLKMLESRYFIFMAIYLSITFVVYSIRYGRGRKKLRKFYAKLQQLDKLYEEEEARTRPTGGDNP